MKEKQTLENICLGEKDKINWKESENSICPTFYCTKLSTMSLRWTL